MELVSWKPGTPVPRGKSSRKVRKGDASAGMWRFAGLLRGRVCAGRLREGLCVWKRQGPPEGSKGPPKPMPLCVALQTAMLTAQCAQVRQNKDLEFDEAHDWFAA